MQEPPLILQIVELVQRRRARRRAARRRAPALALRAGAFVLGAAGVLLGVLALAALPAYRYVARDLPDVTTLPVLLDAQRGLLLQPTRLLERSGVEVVLTFSADGGARKFIQSGDAPALSSALIASSDPSFWQHGGALWARRNLEPSTLAERLADGLLLAGEPDGWRKTLRTRILAGEISARFGRAQVLNWALNSANFGHWTFGAESAAQFYFDKPAGQLSPMQAAALAAIASAPAIDPLQSPDTIEQLARLVLVAMHNQQLISDADLAAALAEPLRFAPTAAPLELSAFSQLALTQAEAALGAARLQRGGLTITTTQDLQLQQQLQASGVPASLVLDVQNGRVLAAAGAAGAASAAASTLLPFLYLDAFANGAAPASLTWNLDAAALPGLLGALSMRQALANGLAQPAQDALQQLGAHHVVNVLAAAGFSAFRDAWSEDTAAAGILGGATVNPLELAAAYASLGSGQLSGQPVQGRLAPTVLLFATDETGRVVLDWSVPQYEALASAELGYLVIDALSDVSVRPVAARQSMLALGRPAALSPQGAGEWQVVATPQRVVVSLGAGEAWPQLFAAAHAGLPIRDWRAPGGLSSVMVCVPSGQLPDGDCPQTRREYFLSGSEPRFTDSLYQRLAVNSLNGRLATVFTPAEFIQEQVFLQAPANLQAAALAAGIALAPQEYDTVPAVQSPGLEIVAPQRFASVNGVVSVRGDAPGAAHWDLQVGQGLYPQRWFSLAEGQAGGAIFARWDTAGLSGLWAIQLQVWDEDGAVQRAYSVVSIEQP